MDGLARELSLAPEQVEKIRAGLGVVFADARQGLGSEKVTTYLHAFSAAFESPSFDAKTLATADVMNAHLGTWGAARMAHFYEAVPPVLTPGQRTKLGSPARVRAAMAGRSRTCVGSHRDFGARLLRGAPGVLAWRPSVLARRACLALVLN